MLSMLWAVPVLFFAFVFPAFVVERGEGSRGSGGTGFDPTLAPHPSLRERAARGAGLSESMEAQLEWNYKERGADRTRATSPHLLFPPLSPQLYPLIL